MPFFHEAGVNGDEWGVEDAVDMHHAEDDVAGVGGDFDDDFATSVECAEYLLYLCLLVVFDSDDDFFDVVGVDELFHVAGGAEVGHDGGETGFGGGGGFAVDRHETDEDVARVGLLVFEVEVGLVGFVVAADEEGGEADLAVVHLVDDGGCLDEAAGVGEAEMDDEDEEEGDVVVIVGAHLVVEHEHEEENHDADDAGDGGLLEFLEAGFSENVFVGALHGIERKPAHGDKDDAQPEVGVGDNEPEVVEGGVLKSYLAEYEEECPRKHGTENVEEDIS